MEGLETFPFDKTDKVLDLGCGTGSITAEIAAIVPLGIVIGLDISESMLTYAREHYQSSNIIYTQGDARNLPFIEQFDKVTAFLSLNWIMNSSRR
jgi:trans-aconitate 2-methyltransferase